MASRSGNDDRIADCMRRMVRGQQPEESGGSAFNISKESLQELVNLAVASDQNKRVLFAKDALRPIAVALDASYGDDINALAADLIGLLAEGSIDQARCCECYRNDRLGVKQRLTQMSRSDSMRVRTSARAALYSMQVTPAAETLTGTQPNHLEVALNPQQGQQITSLGSENLERRGLPTTMPHRSIFEGELGDVIFRSICHELGSEWQALATQLRVPYQLVSKLQADIPRDTSQQCFQMLRNHWYNRQCFGMSDQQSKAKLIQALQHKTVGRNDVAHKLDYIIEDANRQLPN